jgi:hypothetical protein
MDREPVPTPLAASDPWQKAPRYSSSTTGPAVVIVGRTSDASSGNLRGVVLTELITSRVEFSPPNGSVLRLAMACLEGGAGVPARLPGAAPLSRAAQPGTTGQPPLSRVIRRQPARSQSAAVLWEPGAAILSRTRHVFLGITMISNFSVKGFGVVKAF